MPRSGAMVLTDFEDPKMRLLCQKCGLRRQYDVVQLLNHVGNAMVPSLIDELARRNGCERAERRLITDQCHLRMRTVDDPLWVASAPRS